MQLFLFDNNVIHEYKNELSECFLYDDSEVSADLCDVNLQPFIDEGLDISNGARHWSEETKQYEDAPIDRSIYVRVTENFEQQSKEFSERCKELSVQEKDAYILSFMAAIFLRTTKKLIQGTIIQEILDAQEIYRESVRLDMLKLYIAMVESRKKKKLRPKTTIRFDVGKAVTIGENKFNWFDLMLKEYLESHLNVSSLEEAKKELENLYPTILGKHVKPDQLFINFIIASTYNFIARNIIKDDKVTARQCELLLVFLESFEFLPPKDNRHKLNNLQSAVKSLVVDSNNIVVERYRRMKNRKVSPDSNIWNVF